MDAFYWEYAHSPQELHEVYRTLSDQQKTELEDTEQKLKYQHVHFQLNLTTHDLKSFGYNHRILIKKLHQIVHELKLQSKSDHEQIEILQEQNMEYKSHIDQLEDKVLKLESQAEALRQTTDDSEESSYFPPESDRPKRGRPSNQPSRKRSWESKAYAPGNGLRFKLTSGKVRLFVNGSSRTRRKRQRRESSPSSVDQPAEEVVDESDVEGEEAGEGDPFEDAVDSQREE